MSELKDLVLKKDTLVDGDLKCLNIRCEGGVWDLTVKGNIDAWNIYAGNIDARDIYARNIDARNIYARNINARNIDARNIDARNIYAENIDVYAFCIAYKSLKCESITARRENHVIKCLDQEIEYITKKETEHKCVCKECGK